MSFHVLLVEDSDDDATFFQRALQEVDSEVQLTRVRSATAGGCVLKQEPPFSQVPRPDLIVSDCRLENERGADLLEWVRAHPRFKDLRFVMLCSDPDPLARQQAIALGVDQFISKPCSLPELREVVRAIILEAMAKKRSVGSNS